MVPIFGVTVSDEPEAIKHSGLLKMQSDFSNSTLIWGRDLL